MKWSGDPDCIIPEQIAVQLLNKRRREEASDQLLAQYDEIAQKAVSYKEFKTFNNQPTKTITK